MTKTKKADTDWADHIGSSDFPADEFTFTEGSNYGLDGYTFDGTMNEGVLMSARLPSVRGLSGLPEGLVTDPKEASVPADKITEDLWGFDLSSMLSEEEGALHLDKATREAASLVDLSWLDPTQEQDPSRLPKGLHPEAENANNAIPELVEAWGSGKQTTGLELVPGIKEREIARYEKAISSGPRSGLPGNKTAEDTREILFRAMRRSTFGHPISEIKSEVAHMLGAQAPRVKKAMTRIEAEHGLAGTVFIRAAAFPGIKNGKWVKELRRAAKTARYVVTDDAAVADKLKMKAVSEVPWKAALRHYRPLLSAAGYRVASSGNPRNALRAAFLAGPAEAPAPMSVKPIEVKPADRVTDEVAKKAFASAPSPERQVVDLAEKRTASQRRKALVRIAKWVRAGLLGRGDALKLHASKASPEMLLQTGAQLITASGRQSAYAGTGTLQIPEVARVTRKAAWSALKTAETQADKEQGALENHRFRQFRRHVAKMVQGGLMTKEEAARLTAQSRPLGELYKLAAAVAAQREKSAGAQVEAPSVAIYRGTAFKKAYARRPAPAKDFAETDKRLIAIAKKAGVPPDNIPAVLRWAKKQGGEPSKLAALIKTKFGAAAAAAKLKATEPDALPEVKTAATYTGPVYKMASGRRSAGKPALSPKQAERVAKFARQQMTEGMVGADLDAMLQAKFAQPVRKATKKILRVLRSEHEGLSGHLYVDAEAYMSPTGTSGCDEGALKHRTNGLKYVLAADRCAGCIHASESRCKLYRKMLASEPPIKNPKAYQRKMLAASKASDGEITASYFNASEFDLNDPFEDIELNEAASTENLGEILFGEMHT